MQHTHRSEYTHTMSTHSSKNHQDKCVTTRQIVSHFKYHNTYKPINKLQRNIWIEIRMAKLHMMSASISWWLNRTNPRSSSISAITHFPSHTHTKYKYIHTERIRNCYYTHSAYRERVFSLSERHRECVRDKTHKNECHTQSTMWRLPHVCEKHLSLGVMSP